MAPLNSAELELCEKLLVNKNPDIRLSAMALLDKKYLDPARIHAHAHAMTTDNEQQIQDRAYRILDRH